METEMTTAPTVRRFTFVFPDGTTLVNNPGTDEADARARLAPNFEIELATCKEEFETVAIYPHVAKRFGFKVPVHFTREVWDQFVAITKETKKGEKESDRLNNILILAATYIGRNRGKSVVRVCFRVRLKGEPHPVPVYAKAVISPGNTRVTIMLPTQG